MNIEVYCDESYPDLFLSQVPSARFLVIGSLWLASENREPFKEEIRELRNKHKIGGEFKWTKVSPSRIDFYRDILKWFYEKKDSLRFRCIAVDRQKINLIKFHDNDQELGFYKFYYQLLHQWIYSFNNYVVFCDYKRDRLGNRLETLKKCLAYSNLSASVENIQFVRSRESVLLQLSDVLTGMAAARVNNRLAVSEDGSGSSKHEATLFLEKLLGRKIGPTSLHEKKFNVFRINLQGGW